MSSPCRRSVPLKRKRFRWLRVKHIARSQLNRFPLLKGPAIRMWKTVKLFSLRCKWRLATLIGTLRGTYARDVDVDKMYWVSPQKIVYSALREFNIHDFKGHVIGGDWDRLEKRFEDLDVCIALKQVCLEGKDWTETVFYHRAIDELNQGHYLWGCKDKSDFDQRCKGLESLFHRIRQEGYKSQCELMHSGQVYDPMQAEEEVTVSIGRHGDLLFSDGAHRLAIAKLLGIPEIPVKIAARHPEWMRLRKELLLYAQGEGGATYQPMTHIDLSDIPAFHGCEDRFSMIKEHLSTNSGRLLDIGANLGYFCHRFADEGFECYAVENVRVNVYFLEKLKRAENKKFKVIGESVLECREIRNVHFDVVLALNIFHHFLKTRESYGKLVELLENLQMEELFFEPHSPDESQMQGAYKDYPPGEFVQFLLSQSSLREAEFIGVARDGRPLYRLH
jgi:hypothetical protein